MPTAVLPLQSRFDVIIQKRKDFISNPKYKDRLYVITHPRYRFALTFVQERNNHKNKDNYAHLLPPSAKANKAPDGSLSLNTSLGAACAELSGVGEFSVLKLSALFSVFISWHEEAISQLIEQPDDEELANRFSVTFPISAFMRYMGCKAKPNKNQREKLSKEIEKFGSLYGVIYDTENREHYKIYNVLTDYAYDERTKYVMFRSPYMAMIIHQFYKDKNTEIKRKKGGKEQLIYKPNYTDIVKSAICSERNKAAAEMAVAAAVSVVRGVNHIRGGNSVEISAETLAGRSPRLKEAYTNSDGKINSTTITNAFNGFWKVWDNRNCFDWSSYPGVIIDKHILYRLERDDAVNYTEEEENSNNVRLRMVKKKMKIIPLTKVNSSNLSVAMIPLYQD